MKVIRPILFLSLLYCLLVSFTTHSDKQILKIKKKIEKTLKVDDLELKTTSESGVYQFWREGVLWGTLHFRRLTPKSDPMEYAVVLDKENKIIFFKILSYTSSYGYQVTLPRWCKQFLGQSTEELKIGQTVDAVSGATLSVKAIVEDIKEASQ